MNYKSLVKQLITLFIITYFTDYRFGTFTQIILFSFADILLYLYVPKVYSKDKWKKYGAIAQGGQIFLWNFFVNFKYKWIDFIAWTKEFIRETDNKILKRAYLRPSLHAAMWVLVGLLVIVPIAAVFCFDMITNRKPESRPLFSELDTPEKRQEHSNKVKIEGQRKKFEDDFKKYLTEKENSHNIDDSVQNFLNEF